MSKILIVYYSMYTHIYTMAKALAEGVRDVPGCEVLIKRVPETLPKDVLSAMGAMDAQKSMEQIPLATVDDLALADAIIFGTPTRFGNMCGQMRQFLDATGQLWMQGALVGKIGSVFTSSATQHGGQESTILSFHTTLLHHGMIIVGLPYSFAGQMDNGEITGGSPYGASTIAGTKGERIPSANELAGARFQGAHVARIAQKLAWQKYCTIDEQPIDFRRIKMKKVQIDQEECIGCEACVELCPEVFAFDTDLSKAHVTTPEGGNQQCIEEAIASCPVNCITNEEE